MTSVAVVIPVKNGFPEIRDCISGILNQSVKVNKILVIDSGSADGTLDYLRTVPQVQLHIIDSHTFNHGATRNLGWQLCSEDFLVYTVQDACAVNATWIEELLAPFVDPAVSAVGGQQVVPHHPDKNPADWYRPISTPGKRKMYFPNTDLYFSSTPEQKKSYCSLDNVTAAYRRSALMKIPFHRTHFAEDALWARDALLAGHTIVYNSAAQVYHYHLEDPQFTWRRTLIVAYHMYRYFGFVPQPHQLTLKRKLSLVRLLLQSKGLTNASRLQWYRYNIEVNHYYNKAVTAFNEVLGKDDEALDAFYIKECGELPVPVKSTSSH